MNSVKNLLTTLVTAKEDQANITHTVADGTLNKIKREFENTILTSSEKLQEAIKKESNRWRSFILFCEARKTAAEDELKDLKEKEEFDNCKEKIKAIDLYISTAEEVRAQTLRKFNE